MRRMRMTARRSMTQAPGGEDLDPFGVYRVVDSGWATSDGDM